MAAVGCGGIGVIAGERCARCGEERVVFRKVKSRCRQTGQNHRTRGDVAQPRVAALQASSLMRWISNLLHGSTRDSEGSLNDKANVNCVIGNQKIYCRLHICTGVAYYFFYAIASSLRHFHARHGTAHNGLDNVNAHGGYQD